MTSTSSDHVSSPSSMETLPPELLQQILIHVPLCTLFPCQRVSRSFGKEVKYYLDRLLHLPRPSCSPPPPPPPPPSSRAQEEEDEDDKIIQFLQPRFGFLISAPEVAMERRREQQQQQKLATWKEDNKSSRPRRLVWNRDTIIHLSGPWYNDDEEEEREGKEEDEEETMMRREKRRREIWEAYTRPEASWRGLGLGLLADSGGEEGGGRKRRRRKVAITRLESMAWSGGMMGQAISYWRGWREGEEEEEEEGDDEGEKGKEESSQQGFTLGMLWDLVVTKQDEGGIFFQSEDDWDIFFGKRIVTDEEERGVEGGKKTDWERFLRTSKHSDMFVEDEGSVVLYRMWWGSCCDDDDDDDDDDEPLGDDWIPRPVGRYCDPGEQQGVLHSMWD